MAGADRVLPTYSVSVGAEWSPGGIPASLHPVHPPSPPYTQMR